MAVKMKLPIRLIAAAMLLTGSGIGLLVLAKDQWHRSWYWLFACGILIGLIWMILEFLLLRNNTLKYLSQIDSALNDTLHNVPVHMPLPIAILGEEHEIIWYNERFFTSIAGGEDMYGMQIQETVPLRPDALGDGESMDIDLFDRHFRITRTDYETDGRHTELLCFQDISNYMTLRQNYMDMRPCVLMIVIDNSEDLFNGTRQSERASVLAALETLFDRFLEGTESVFCHLDEDRFLVVTEARHCLEMERARFPLLDAARNITVSGKSALTLSIGVGRSGENLAQNERFAQMSLDMALGRGGDQAAIKTDEGFIFYGGVSKGIEHKNKAKNRAIARDLVKLMKRCRHVYIMGHRNSDLDAVGAAVGVAFIAEQTDIPYNIVIRQDASLATLLIERIRQEMPGVMITPEAAREQLTDQDLLVIVDTFSKDIVEDAALYQQAKHVVVIDHHRQMVNYMNNAMLKLHDPHASSAAELVTGMIQYFDWRDQMPQFFAEALLSGIMLDTKNFIMQTGVHTFEMAAFLRERGADPIAVKALFAASLDAYRHRSALVANAELYRGRYAIAVAKESVPDIQIIASQAADELLGVENAVASFVVFSRGTQGCISARSLGAMNVQVVMEQLGGGGHQIMAATQQEGVSPEELKQKLCAVLDIAEQ